MYQSQSYQTANYRGNQPGHDAYLRSDSTTASSSSYGVPSTTQSQYRGFQKPFQPTGYVSSSYGQNQGQMQSQSFATGSLGSTSSNVSYGASVNPQSYHTANYRGDQPGHDNYLRADSTQPSNMGTSTYSSQNQNFTPSYSTYNSGVNYGTGSSGSMTGYQTGSTIQSGLSNFGQSQVGTSFTSPQSYHTANYRGDQPGHDNYLRADSVQPAQSQFGSVTGGFTPTGYTSTFGSNAGFTSSVNTGIPTSINSGISSMNTGVNQFTSPQSYHTANYRGDQPGHDNYLRADSTQTAQNQFGGFSSSNTGSFNTMGSSFNTNRSF